RLRECFLLHSRSIVRSVEWFVAPQLPAVQKTPLRARAASARVEKAKCTPLFNVRGKFALAMLFGLSWFALTTWIALPWIADLARLTNWTLAILIVGGIALVPGLMNAFLAASLLLDRRPKRDSFQSYPGVTVPIAAYNEEESILETLR